MRRHPVQSDRDRKWSTGWPQDARAQPVGTSSGVHSQDAWGYNSWGHAREFPFQKYEPDWKQTYASLESMGLKDADLVSKMDRFTRKAWQSALKASRDVPDESFRDIIQIFVRDWVGDTASRLWQSFLSSNIPAWNFSASMIHKYFMDLCGRIGFFGTSCWPLPCKPLVIEEAILDTWPEYFPKHECDLGSEDDWSGTKHDHKHGVSHEIGNEKSQGHSGSDDDERHISSFVELYNLDSRSEAKLRALPRSLRNETMRDYCPGGDTRNHSARLVACIVARERKTCDVVSKVSTTQNSESHGERSWRSHSSPRPKRHRAEEVSSGARVCVQCSPPRGSCSRSVPRAQLRVRGGGSREKAEESASGDISGKASAKRSSLPAERGAISAMSRSAREGAADTSASAPKRPKRTDQRFVKEENAPAPEDATLQVSGDDQSRKCPGRTSDGSDDEAPNDDELRAQMLRTLTDPYMLYSGEGVRQS